MPTSHSGALTRQCKKRLVLFPQRSPRPELPYPMEQVVSEITTIVSQNLPERFERYSRYRSRKHRLTLDQYIDEIIEYWFAEAPRVHRLKAKEPDAWRSLNDDLAQVAAHRLSRSTHIHSAALTATDFANRACEIIFQGLRQARYPFDVPFDAWARTILKNLILERGRSSDVLDRVHVSLDAPTNTRDETGQPVLENLPDQKTESSLSLIQAQETILNLLHKLRSPLQQAAIVMRYFDGLDDKEIARRLGKTEANVQVLCHRAVRHMAQFVNEPWVKEKQPFSHQTKYKSVKPGERASEEEGTFQ